MTRNLLLLGIVLSQTRLSSWYVAPFLDNRLLNLSWVGSRSRTNFFWNINTFLGRFEKRNQFGNMFANSLRLQVTSFIWNFLNDGFFSIETFFFSWNLGGAGSANFSWYFLTFCFWAVLLDISSTCLTFLYWPFGTFLFGCITLGDILTLLFLDGFTFNGVISHIMLFISGCTSRFINSLTDFWTTSFQLERSVTEFNGFL